MQVLRVSTRATRELVSLQHKHKPSRTARLTVSARQGQGEREARQENVPGDYFVDFTCINCDTCRAMAPDTFSKIGDMSAVHQQPTSHEARVGALQALLSCPTFSIHTNSKSKEELRDAQDGLPRAVPGVPGVFLNGWTSEQSAGADSYLIQRPGGNILVDSPRFNPVLAKRMEALGGVKYMFLTHKDDVADHRKWAKHFGATRVLHATEVNGSTEDVEIKLQGKGPWLWRDIEAGRGDSTTAPLAASGLPQEESEITLLFTPGHTEAHVCLFNAPLKTLFSGDHLSAPPSRATEGVLYVYEDFNWYSVALQLESVRKLEQVDFLHVLPGHGRMAHFADGAGRVQAMEDLLQQHQGATDGHGASDEMFGYYKEGQQQLRASNLA